MGAGVSTEGAPLTRVKCKNNIGVLFDPEAEAAFRATATGPEGEETVPWPEAAAYVKTRDERCTAVSTRAWSPRWEILGRRRKNLVTSPRRASS